MDSRKCQTSTATPAKPGVFPLFDKRNLTPFAREGGVGRPVGVVHRAGRGTPSSRVSAAASFRLSWPQAGSRGPGAHWAGRDQIEPGVLGDAARLAPLDPDPQALPQIRARVGQIRDPPAMVLELEQLRRGTG